MNVIAALLRAVAELGSLEAACAKVGLSRAVASALLRAQADTLEPRQVVAAAPPPAAAPPAGVHRVRVFSDGAARGNPGPAGAGAVVVDEGGRTLARLGKYLGPHETNNVAEYEAALLGLRGALELGARQVELVADSLLVIEQLKGNWKVKMAHLVPLHAEAKRLLGRFEKASLRHVPREQNKAADEMSNRAIDEKMA